MLVKTDSRISFGIDYYDSEAEADAAGAVVRERGETYNGGWFDGMRCGRDRTFDCADRETGVRLYAVTRA